MCESGEEEHGGLLSQFKIATADVCRARKSIEGSADLRNIGADGPSVERYMECIRDVGQEYGLSFNWGKLEMLAARCEGNIWGVAGGGAPTPLGVRNVCASCYPNSNSDKFCVLVVLVREPKARHVCL